jgi:hypothetical protein
MAVNTDTDTGWVFKYPFPGRGPVAIYRAKEGAYQHGARGYELCLGETAASIWLNPKTK